VDSTRICTFIEPLWRERVVPELIEYIRIPNKSPHFDPDWERHGHMERAVRRFAAWARHAPVPNLAVEVIRLPGRTPVLLCEAHGGGAGTVLLYGHLDKQPEMDGWRADLGPWTPVLDGDRLYGRGGADDGYALFASLAALGALADQGLPYARCVLLIEACEESGSYDLPAYLDALDARIGSPDLVVCLDSGCGNYEQLWCTTSLRGLVSGVLGVRVLDEGVHSGDASGIVPSSFRLLRALLSRIEDEASGVLQVPQFYTRIPALRQAQAREASAVLGEALAARFPFAGTTRPVADDPFELILDRTWRPGLEVTGAGGLPALADAGNVLRPYTAARLSLRLPPPCSAAAAAACLTERLEADPPCGASVSFVPEWQADGWEAPAPAPWLEQALEDASQTFFGKPAMHMGEGGTIPFMSMLGRRFADAQFLITGVLGPHANAHGPNEFLHLPTARRLSACVAAVLARHAGA